jgi:two-component system nitrate/nitrite response regulator NarL
MNAPARVRVLIADDHPLYRDGIVRAIQQRPDLEVVAECATSREAASEIRSLKPDVALLDLRVGSVNGLEVLRVLGSEGPTRVLILSAHTDPASVFDAIAAGAAGYLAKDVDRTEICDAIRAVARAERVFSNGLREAVIGEIPRRAGLSAVSLSPREREVLALVADGRVTPEIATLLYLSQSTVKTHLKNLYGKLGVSDRAAAVAEAMRRGLLH